MKRIQERPQVVTIRLGRQKMKSMPANDKQVSPFEQDDRKKISCRALISLARKLREQCYNPRKSAEQITNEFLSDIVRLRGSL